MAQQGKKPRPGDKLSLTDDQINLIGDAIDDALGRYTTKHRSNDTLSSLGITGLNLYRLLKIIRDDLEPNGIIFDMHALLVSEAKVQQVEACQVDQFSGLVASVCSAT